MCKMCDVVKMNPSNPSQLATITFHLPMSIVDLVYQSRYFMNTYLDLDFEDAGYVDHKIDELLDLNRNAEDSDNNEIVTIHAHYIDEAPHVVFTIDLATLIQQ